MDKADLQYLLAHIQQRTGLSEEQRTRLLAGVDSPWWLSVLLGLAAWVSSLFLMGSLLGPSALLLDGPVGIGLAGLLMLCAGLWLFGRMGVFFEQMGLAFALGGQGLLVYVLADAMGSSEALRSAAIVCLPLSAILLLGPGSMLYRRICGLLVLGSIAVLLESGPGLALYGLLLACVATVSWLRRLHWAGDGLALHLRALSDAATLMALLLAMYGHQGVLDAMTGHMSVLTVSPGVWLLIHAGPGLLLLLTLAWLLRGQPVKARSAGLLAAGLLILLTYQAPGLLISLALGLCVYHAGSRSWCMVVPAFALFYLGEFYYSLHLSLLHKSLLLCASGFLLLVIRLGMRRLFWSPL
ncbi:DUF4401 domain-containing protein [Halopseudomonas pelagia]|uniref:DUF4401 domain-containing protein n=1 Tax=Halopseudomonas pelagia TaxID=553151 RepID=UPI0003A666B8|nr:DUF4401 domain-containing protein [Halopseudomonas pelagia]